MMDFPSVVDTSVGANIVNQANDLTPTFVATAAPVDLSPTGAQASFRSSEIAAQTATITAAKDQNNARNAMPDPAKRLNVVRSRAAKGLSNGEAYTSERGAITYMRLLKNPDYDVKASVGSNVSKIGNDIDSLLSGKGSGFTNFFVTGLNVTYSEKTQIMTTFGDNEVVYYFGKQPIIFNITGLLFDSLENDWFSKFVTLYSTVLRGSQLAKNFGLIELTFPNMVITGSISQLSTNQDSARDTDIPFTMQFIAKNVVPLPIDLSPVALSNISTSFINFAADRTGVAGYSLSSGNIGGGFMESVTSTIGDVSGALGGIMGGLSSAAASVSSTLSDFRTNIFSPIFGVISSITKIVKSVTGTITSIISSFTNPVNQILRDITNIATQASGLALLVESSINSVVSIPGRTITNLKNTIASLKGAAGTITRVPENIADNFRRYNSGGSIRNSSAILSSGKSLTKSKSAVLSSGHPYSIAKSNTL